MLKLSSSYGMLIFQLIKMVGISVPAVQLPRQPYNTKTNTITQLGAKSTIPSWDSGTPLSIADTLALSLYTILIKGRAAAEESEREGGKNKNKCLL